MKKRILVTLLLASMCLSLVACSNNSTSENKEPDTTVVDTDTEKDTTTEDTEKASEIDSDILAGTYNVPLERIYVNIPNEFQGVQYRNVESGKTQIWNIGYELNVCLSADFSEKVETMDEAIEKSFNTYKRGIDNYLDAEKVVADKEDILVVNGIQVYKFEGKLVGKSHMDMDLQLYTIGCVFVIDGIPCRLQGMVQCYNENCEVFDKETHVLMEQEVRETVESMIQTIRTEE